MNLEISRAELKTLSVEIKALTVSGKQMSLSVFRQLDQAGWLSLITGAEGGTLWGRVEYFWDECKKSDHLHIVWQEGNSLFRDCLFEHVNTRTLLFQDLYLLERLNFLYRCLGERPEYCGRGRLKFKGTGDFLNTDIVDQDFVDKVHLAWSSGQTYDRESGEYVKHPPNPVPLEEYLKNKMHELGIWDHSGRGILNAIAKAKDRIESLKKKWFAGYQKALDSDHLFISA